MLFQKFILRTNVNSTSSVNIANSVTKLHSSKLCGYAKLLHVNKRNILYLQLRMGSQVTETKVR